VQCVQYCILHPHLVPKALHFVLAVAVVLGTLAAAARVQLPGGSEQNLLVFGKLSSRFFN
jgi:hypothetical protein